MLLPPELHQSALLIRTQACSRYLQKNHPKQLLNIVYSALFYGAVKLSSAYLAPCMSQDESFMKNTYTFDLTDLSHWKSCLAEQGFTVLRGVVPAKTCEARIGEMRALLMRLSKGKLTDKESSWKVAGNYPFLLHGGMAQYLGHSQLQWQSRDELRVVFEQYWETDELKTSFDGLCYMDGRRNYEPRSMTSFLHSDQSPHKQGVWSIQGFLNLGESGDGAGGLVVLPKSHLLHRDYFESRRLLSVLKPDNHWYKFSEQEKTDPLFQGAIVVETGPGDVALWDSRTFHCNTVPMRPSARAVVYVCMLPTSQVAPHIQRKRQAAWKDRRCASHHPGDGFRAFPATPRFSDLDYSEVLAVQQPTLTDAMLALI
jgi:hypothetical protein